MEQLIDGTWDVFITFAGIFLALWIERKRRCDLKITEAESLPLIIEGELITFLRLNVENVKLNKFLQYFYNREPALRTWATITYLDSKGQQLFPKIIGRWASSLQPCDIYSTESTIQGQRIALTNTRYIDIWPDHKEFLEIALRLNKNLQVYAFANESYEFYPIFDKPEWKIECDEIIVVVEVFSGTQTFKKNFRVNIGKLFDSFSITDGIL